jgi:predicted RNase H-like HicB family nuclease
MKALERYIVTFERDEAGWWVTRIREVPGCMTQGRTIEQARRRIREALALFIGSSARSVPLISHVALPATIRRKVELATASRRRAELENARARVCTLEAAQLLAAEGLSARDTGELLGVTRQRAHQLSSTTQAAARR